MRSLRYFFICIISFLAVHFKNLGDILPVIADLCRHTAPAIVDVLGSGLARLGGDALQTVGVVGFLAVDAGRDHHAVAHEDVPSERCRSFGVGYCVQQAVGVVGIGLGGLAIRPALEQVQG